MKFQKNFLFLAFAVSIFQSNDLFCMKRKGENQEISSNKKIKKMFDCPYSGQGCKAKRHNGCLTSVNQAYCNNKLQNSRQPGFAKEIDLHSHILNFHRICPFCSSVENTTGMSIEKLVKHMKEKHPNKASILHTCSKCNDYIELTLNKHYCAQQHAKNCTFFSTAESRTMDYFSPPPSNVHLQHIPQTQATPPTSQQIFITQNITHYNIYQNSPSQIPYFSEFLHSRPIIPANTTQFCPIYHPNLYEPNSEETSVLAESFQFQNSPTISNNNNNNSNSNDIAHSTFSDFDGFDNVENLNDFKNDILSQFFNEMEVPQNNETDPVINELELVNNLGSNIPQLFDEIGEEFLFDQIEINENTVNQTRPVYNPQPKISNEIKQMNANHSGCPYQNLPIISWNCGVKQERICKVKNINHDHLIACHKICPECRNEYKPYPDENITNKDLAAHLKDKHKIDAHSCQYCDDFISTSESKNKDHEKVCFLGTGLRCQFCKSFQARAKKYLLEHEKICFSRKT